MVKYQLTFVKTLMFWYMLDKGVEANRYINHIINIRLKNELLRVIRPVRFKVLA